MQNFGHFVSDFVHSIPSDPVTPQGQLLSSFIHEINIPGNPIAPGDLISEFVHSIQTAGEPITPQMVSDFVHELHNPVSDGFLIT